MRVGIVGLGYVGLPLAVSFAEADCDVIGVDVDGGRIAAISEGRSPVEDITDERLRAALARGPFTTRLVELHQADPILGCGPPPPPRNPEPGLRPLVARPP